MYGLMCVESDPYGYFDGAFFCLATAFTSPCRLPSASLIAYCAPIALSNLIALDNALACNTEVLNCFIMSSFSLNKYVLPYPAVV